MKRGGTKKKSRNRTLSNVVSTDGRRPSLKPAIVVPSRYTITMFAASKGGYRSNIIQASAVHAIEIPAAHA